MEAAWMSMNSQMDKEDMIYIYVCVCMYIYSRILPIHKKWNNDTWMDLEIIILSEISWTKKDKYNMIEFICEIWNNDTNEMMAK